MSPGLQKGGRPRQSRGKWSEAMCVGGARGLVYVMVWRLMNHTGVWAKSHSLPRTRGPGQSNVLLAPQGEMRTQSQIPSAMGLPGKSPGAMG